MKIQTQSRWQSTILVLIAVTVLGAGAGFGAKVGGIVVKEVDGDTLWVEKGRPGPDGEYSSRKPVILKIRMVGIDAPESCFPTTGGCQSQGHFGTDSKNELAALAPVGAKVSVEEKGLDKYNRTLGRVFVRKSDVNLEMVRRGVAVTYIICEGESCNKTFLKKENVEGYSTACHEARENGLGLWNLKDSLTEMPFEFRMRLSGRKPDKFVGDVDSMYFVEPENYKEIDACNRVFFKSAAEAEAAGFSERRSG